MPYVNLSSAVTIITIIIIELKIVLPFIIICVILASSICGVCYLTPK